MDNQFMSKPGVDGDQQRLYEIEKLVKIVEEEGQKFVIVKWKGFSSHENTKEPYEYIKKLQLSREEMQHIEQEYQQKNLTTIVNIKAKHKEYYHEYRTKIFPETKPLKRDRSWLKQDLKLSIQEKSRCKLKAYEQMKDKLQFGLNDLNTQDYIHFMNLHHLTENLLKKMINIQVFSRYDKILEDIKGVYRNEEGFIFYVQVEQDVYTCTFDEMIKYFPQSMNTFLDEFNEYMRIYMKQDLQGHQKLCNGRFNRMKEISKSKYIIKMKKAFDIPKDSISFGFDEDDAMENRKSQLERKLELGEIKKQLKKQINAVIPEVEEENINKDKGQKMITQGQMMISEGQEKKEVENIQQPIKTSVVDEMYKEMLQTMNNRGIKSFLSFDQKGQSKKQKNSKPNQPVMEMQDFLNQSSSSSQDSSDQVQFGNSKRSKNKMIHKREKGSHSRDHMTLRKRKSNKSFNNSNHSQKSKKQSSDSKKSKSPNSKNGRTSNNNSSPSPNSKHSSNSGNKSKSKNKKKSNRSPNSSISSSGRQFDESEGRRGNATPTRSSNRLKQAPRINYSTVDFMDAPDSEGSSSELRRSKWNKKV